MKNIAVLTVLVIIFGVYSYAEENEKNYCFSIGPQFGFIYGQAEEYVYPKSGETKGELLSELTWDMKPLFYCGIQAKFNRADIMKGPGLFSLLSFKIGIPADSGVIEDRDWQSTENGDLTNFSKHTNRTDEFFQLDAAFGVSLPVKSIFYLKPFFIGCSWTRFAFTGRDGYVKYANKKSSTTYYPIDDDPYVHDYSGEKVVSYIQDWLILTFGFSAGTTIFYPFSFELSFQISPLTYCAATDTHLLTNTVFRDFTDGGLFIEPSFNASFAVKNVELSLGLSYRRIGKTKGESYVNENDAGFYLDSYKAGAGLSMLDSRFLVCVRL